MEPRARAAKNLGKMTFNNTELTQLLYAHGDVQNPLPETIRVLDEIATDFIQSLAFDATRAANYAGRQKVKFEDFEFVFRKNPMFLGKVQEVIEKKSEIDSARRIIDDSEHAIIKNAGNDDKDKDKDKHGTKKDTGAGAAQADDKTKTVADEEELGEADDDTEDIVRKK
ncbi:hypothetical protein TD95_004656 [Thielaviopsis punctulata]|uniref:Transcription initiation factor TFIID subunit 13 n=1 Tax=Thielaviopsis punctulata TaxID=72032 RepID=A0A0F4ZHL2_9PEZI|nr:hypothetical protein TD95_004656 [Thielaviopsis punctulata]